MVGQRTILINDKEVPIRSYEVSIWTLQDSFITVLKWANIENKGQIQKPKMTLDVDGTQNFKFSIPMYLNGQENPIWYNTLNGNLMIGMRKIKVILNKKLEDEGIFEFLITKVSESHEDGALFCDVECEGLAFHELGKIGYKIEFSQDTFLLDYDEWVNSDQTKEMPKQTIQYWNEKTDFLYPYPENEDEIIPTKWYYKIDMFWDSSNSNLNRDSNKVYENEFVSSWQQALSGELIPAAVEKTKEKERVVEISESNIYNITQKIAESFGVFCRYEYKHDDNYHITSRVVIYYNNFIEEQFGHMDLTYPYHTSEITREMDSSELTTKLFIRPVDYQYSETGQTSIMGVDANKSREDYILNFDYLYKFNIITEEQYQAISEYESNMHQINLQLESLVFKINNLKNKKNDYAAKLAVAEKGIDEAAEQANRAKSKINAISGGDSNGYVYISQKAPKSVLVLTDETDNSFYIKIPFTGVIPDTVQLYDGIIDYTKQTNQLENDYTVLVSGGSLEFDPLTNDLIKITHLPKTVQKKIIITEEEENEEEEQGPQYETVSLSNSLWLTCTYNPTTYWQKVRDYWEDQESSIQQQLSEYEDIIEALDEELDTAQQSYDSYLDQKKDYIKEFNEMMGPALREGYWQPDDYQDYGDKYIINEQQTFNFTEGKLTYNLGDATYHDGNNKVTYYEGPNLKKYLTINLGICGEYTTNSNLEYIRTNYDKLYFIYYDAQGLDQALALDSNEPDPSGWRATQKQNYLRNALRVIRIGGDCRFSFVQNDVVDDTDIKFALIIEASKTMTDDQFNFFRRISKYSDSKYDDYKSKIGVVTTDNNGAFVVSDGGIEIESTNYIRNDAIGQEVYPRIIIDSLYLKTGETQLQIKLGNKLLKQFEDYNFYIDEDIGADRIEREKYIIDIKPKVYIDVCSFVPKIFISYELSNADVLIYLDALEVSKENAEPKVSYTIKLSVYDPYIIHNIYKKLSKIVHINDVQLKFENVQGYISHIEMDLDMPWNDSIEIKNYKTKFEDLFSNIVAQTDSLSKKSYGYDNAATAFDPNGILTEDAVEKMLSNNSTIFKNYVDMYFGNSSTVQDKLTQIFDEAGDILSSASNALMDVKTLSLTNASTLAGFVRGADEGFSHGIDLISSKDGEYTSAVQINNTGIFIGSDQKISLYTGEIGETNGASIDISPKRLILGVSSDSSGTAIKMTEDYLVLAAGNIISNSELNSQENNYVNLNTLDVDGTANGLIGAKFTNNSIGLATMTTENQTTIINAILMNNKGITLGSGIDLTQTTENLRSGNGSYVRISGGGIDVGSGADLYVNTNNCIINSHPEQNTTSIFELRKTGSVIGTYETALKYTTQDGLEIKGKITADQLLIYDQTIPSTQNQYPNATDWVNAKVTPQAIWLGVVKHTTGNSNATIGNSTSLSITDTKFAIDSTGTFEVNTSNVIINTNPSLTSNSIFELKKKASDWTEQNNKYDTALKYSIANGLEITGSLTADTGSIGGWNIGTNLLSSGDNQNNTYVGLDSGTSGQDYAIWAGNSSSSSADFRVKRNGQVYLHQLMVLDSRPLSGGSWGLGGNDNNHDEKHVGVEENGEDPNLYYGYKAIDFSKLNFKQAVSVTGTWSGSAFNVHVSLWGVLNKSEDLTASVSVSGYATVSSITNSYIVIGTLPISYSPGDRGGNLSFELSCEGVYNNGYQAGEPMSITQIASMGNTASFTITRADSKTKNLTCSVQQTYDYAYNAGWNAALDACTSHTCYTGGTYYATLYVAPTGGAQSVSNCRAGQTEHTYYSLPSKRS